MRIILYSVGSRGDIQPIIALAKRFQQEGHTAIVATTPDFADLANEYGVERAIVGPSLSTLMTDEVKKAVESGNFIKLMGYIRKIRDVRKQILEQVNQECLRVAQGADAILYKGPTAFIGYNIAEKLGIPCAEIALFPVTKTKAFPSFILGSGKDRGPFINGLLWWLSEQLFWHLMQRENAKTLRRELGLPPLPFSGPLARQNSEGMPLFNAYSPLVLPRPSDWHPRMHVTGYYFADEPTDWQPSTELQQFLENGPPPICVNFGSMPMRKPEETLQTVVKALELSNQRGILVSGWTSIGKDYPLPKHILRIESTPHSWLFPRMAAIVHHGGAGTTAASLRSGVPSIIIPFNADQPSWGERIHTLGVGPKPIPFKHLTPEKLAETIREAITNENIKQKAAKLGRAMKREDGTGRTIELFRQYVEK